MQLSPRYDGPPILTIEGDPTDQLAPLVRQRRRLLAMLRTLDDAAWATPSRCDGWTVQDVAAHLVGVDAFWRHSVAAGLTGTPTRVLATFDPAATPPLMVGPMRALRPAEVLEKLEAATNAFLALVETLNADDWSTIAESPAGHVPIRVLAHHALWDCWVHERDIMLPLGLTPAVEADEVISSLRYAAALSPGLAITTGNTCTGRFAIDASDPDTQLTLDVDNSVHVRVGILDADAPCLRGDAVALVEALTIRAPLPPATPPEWRTLLTGLATVFDAELESA